MSEEVAYYHVYTSCSPKCRPILVLARIKLKSSEGVEINKDA